jgi:uncharacterized protein (DUF2237 family)
MKRPGSRSAELVCSAAPADRCVRWCLCAPRWQDGLEAGQAPSVVSRATHEGALGHCSLVDLKGFAVDLT